MSILNMSNYDQTWMFQHRYSNQIKRQQYIQVEK